MPEEMMYPEKNVGRGLGYGVFIAALIVLPLLTLTLVDAIGSGYSPHWMDGLEMLLNAACACVWLIVIGIAIGVGLVIRIPLTQVVVLFLMIFAAVQAHPYLLAWDAMKNSSLDMEIPVVEPPSASIAAIWPTPPRHEGREMLERDLDAIGNPELLVIDRYTWPGSSQQRIVHISIYRIESGQYTRLFSDAVDEEGYYDFYTGCPPRASTYLGYHSTIVFLNLDLDRAREMLVHQANETIPPHCSFDHYYDWVGGEIRSFSPSGFWALERGLYFFGLPLIIGLSSLAKKARVLRPLVIVLELLYVGWSVWESWFAVDFYIWAFFGVVATIITILSFWGVVLVDERQLPRFE